MKKQLTILIIGLLMTTMSFAQTALSVRDIQYISPTDLADCKDLSAYDGQDVKTVGIVMHDGNLTELASGSVNGGYRPGVHILDTSSSGMGDFRGIQIHGVYTDGSGQSQPCCNCKHFGMSCWVIQCFNLIESFTNDLIIGNHNSTNWDFICCKRQLCLANSLFHEKFLGQLHGFNYS